MGTVGVKTVLVKFSPKREKMLGDINENVEWLDQERLEVRRESLDKLCTTRWTVRVNRFQKIIDQYDSLQQLWDLCLQEKLTTDVRSKIIGCQAQMQSFKFFFWYMFWGEDFIATQKICQKPYRAKHCLQLRHSC